MGNTESTVVVSGLRPDIHRQEFEEYFIDKGRIKIDPNSRQPMADVRVERNTETQQDVGVAMVTLETAESAREVISSLQGQTINGQTLHLQTAKEYYEQCSKEGRLADMFPLATEKMNTDTAWKLWFTALSKGFGEKNGARYYERWQPYYRFDGAGGRGKGGNGGFFGGGGGGGGGGRRDGGGGGGGPFGEDGEDGHGPWGGRGGRGWGFGEGWDRGGQGWARQYYAEYGRGGKGGKGGGWRFFRGQDGEDGGGYGGGQGGAGGGCSVM